MGALLNMADSKKQTSITIDVDLLKQIRFDADIQNRSVSNFIESCLIDWYEMKQKKIGAIPGVGSIGR